MHEKVLLLSEFLRYGKIMAAVFMQKKILFGIVVIRITVLPRSIQHDKFQNKCHIHTSCF